MSTLRTRPELLADSAVVHAWLAEYRDNGDGPDYAAAVALRAELIPEYRALRLAWEADVRARQAPHTLIVREVSL